MIVSAQTAVTGFNKFGSSGVVEEDKRRNFCKKFYYERIGESVEIHYYRMKITRLFLPSPLNIKQQEYCEDNEILQRATESIYRTVCNTECNMLFFQPKKTCAMFHRYKNGSTDKKYPWMIISFI